MSLPSGVGQGGGGAGEKLVAMEKAGLATCGSSVYSRSQPMSAGDTGDEGLTQSASSQHFRRDPTCQTFQTSWMTQPVPPLLPGWGAVTTSLWRGTPREGGDCRTYSQQGACMDRAAQGVWGAGAGVLWGQEGGVGDWGKLRSTEPVWGLDLGPLVLPGEGLGPGGPSPETLRRQIPRKSQGFPMLTVDSLFPKNTGGMN